MEWMDVFFKIKMLEHIGTWLVVGTIFVSFILFCAYIHISHIIDDIKDRNRRRRGE